MVRWSLRNCLEEESNPKIGCTNCFKVVGFDKVYCAFTAPQDRKGRKNQFFRHYKGTH